MDHGAMSYSTETGKFTRTNPVIRQFVQREINGYELTGFLWFHKREEYTIDPMEY